MKKSDAANMIKRAVDDTATSTGIVGLATTTKKSTTNMIDMRVPVKRAEDMPAAGAHTTEAMILVPATMTEITATPQGGGPTMRMLIDTATTKIFRDMAARERVVRHMADLATLRLSTTQDRLHLLIIPTSSTVATPQPLQQQAQALLLHCRNRPKGLHHRRQLLS